MEFAARTLIMGGENQHLQGCKLQVHVFFFLFWLVLALALLVLSYICNC
jgi:hypothetical protein